MAHPQWQRHSDAIVGGHLFRSEAMQLVQLFVQIDAAHDTVDELGKLGLIQFKDLNPDVSPFQRNFVNEVKKADEMERKMRFFEEQINKEKRDILISKHQDPENLALIPLDPLPGEEVRVYKINELEQKLDELEKEVIEMNNNQDMLNRNYNELIELKHLLTKNTTFFSEVGDNHPRDSGIELERDANSPLLIEPMSDNRGVKLGFLTGLILREKFLSFERVLWRSTRGNLFMKYAEVEEPIKDPSTGEFVDKNVFIIFYQGERAHAKIKKICESFGASLYPCPQTPKERHDLLVQVNERLNELGAVLARTRKHRREVLFDVGRHLRQWKEQVTKEKYIYHTMNMFNYDVGRKCLIAEGWCPKTATEKIVNAMRHATDTSGALVPSILSVVKSKEEPPTYFKTNKFTGSFQGIVNAYGVAHYQEVNPAVFTIITFPFLFAVMFGDFGHGILLTLFAAYLIKNEEKLGKGKLNELFKTCYGGRYLLLLMGLFSIYTGLIYNECFSVAMDIFGTNWEYHGNETEARRIDPDRTYPVGVDPAWNGVPNSLNYYNSLKMKLSIVLGVTQMCLGICMSLLNGLHHHSPLDIFTEFVPQIIFMLSIFGYMVFLIFLKWATNWGTAQPPFLLNVMIYMYLSLYKLEDENKLFDGQLYVQWVCILFTVVTIPWMLFPKPYILKSRYQQKLRARNQIVQVAHKDEHEETDEEFDFGEVFVKQIIHTIEFVLGAISNTASYLRLWALSLAHSELSLVFYERVLIMGFTAGESSIGVQIFMVFCTWGAWAGVTFAVLMVMESLSAFLHALRLHWVEFQNKFYHGDGLLFQPFSYERIFAGTEED